MGSTTLLRRRHHVCGRRERSLVKPPHWITGAVAVALLSSAPSCFATPRATPSSRRPLPATRPAPRSPSEAGRPLAGASAHPARPGGHGALRWRWRHPAGRQPWQAADHPPGLHRCTRDGAGSLRAAVAGPLASLAPIGSEVRLKVVDTDRYGRSVAEIRRSPIASTSATATPPPISALNAARRWTAWGCGVSPEGSSGPGIFGMGAVDTG